MFDAGFFASPKVLFLGALTGFIFGFLLQRGRVAKFETIVGQFLLKDFAVLKIMLTAIIVGSIGVYGMLELGLIETLHVKSAVLFGNILGGIIFGIGMSILGYCPGTGVAAIGEGARDAIFGVLGMLAGAAAYAELYPWFKSNVLSVADLGKETFVTATGVSAWWFILGITVVSLAVFRFVDKRIV